MAFKMNGWSAGRGTGSGFKKEINYLDDKTNPTPKPKPKPKVSYADAYKKRDMKTYGNLTQAEYTAEAKRQKAHYDKTGKWDYKSAPKVEESKKGRKTTRVVNTKDTKTETKKTDRSNVVGDKKVTTTTNKVTGDTKKLKEKSASIIEGPKTKTTDKKDDTITKSKVKAGTDRKLGTDDDKKKSRTRKKGGTGLGQALKDAVAKRKARRAEKKSPMKIYNKPKGKRTKY